MKNSFWTIPLLMLFSCTPRSEPVNLLADEARWLSDSSIDLTNGELTIEDEFETLIYRPGLFTSYINFELSMEVYTEVGGGARFLFHTRKSDLDLGYAVQIDNSKPGDWDRLLKTGSLNSIRNIHYTMVPDQTWFNLKIAVSENQIKVFVDDQPVVDYIEPEIPYRTPEISKRRLNAGTFAIVSNFGNSGVRFRNMVVTPLPSGEIKQNADPLFARKVTQFNLRGFPLMDLHVHKKGDLTYSDLHEQSALSGINYGIAVNGGMGFPADSDSGLSTFLQETRGKPGFKALQAEGREWAGLFSADTIALFDYTFTDAMTWTDQKGRRMRLWIPEETFVEDPEAFMDELVNQIEKILQEPIDIYVNPTYLPAPIADRYEELWTDERIERVITALVENNVALELNDRYRLPGDRVIEMAKKAGVLLSPGTNNLGREDLKNLEWAIETIEHHRLQPTNMYLPGMKN